MYPAYQQPYGAPRPARPPGAPKTLGVLSIIFGGVVLLMQGLSAIGGGGLTSSITGGEFQDYYGMLEGDLASAAKTLNAIGSFHTLVFVLMSIALIVIGVGQVGYKQWAAKASRVWATLALILLALVTVSFFFMMGPMEQLMPALMAEEGSSMSDMPEGFMSGVIVGIALVTAGIYAPYPIVMLVQFRKQRVIDSMTR